MVVYCKYDELVDPKSLENHPKNRNKHGQDQIDRLADMYNYHGIRHPIIVSKLSGFVVAGHGRKLAAIRAGIKEFPVVYQDFDNIEAEQAFLTADNAIALWAELDLAGINSDIPDYGPDFDIKMLGVKNFTLDIAEKYIKDEINNYSDKISTPIYEPKKEIPPNVSELFDIEKYNKLIKDIKDKRLSKEVESFLIYAAARHIVFNYENIAEFYCHQNKEIQNLMESSALIIIDFNKAVENGFVKLTKEFNENFNNEDIEE